MEVMEALRARYSARKYSDRPVEPEKLEKILEAGCLAPTAHNAQLQRHIAVTDPELIKAMVPACGDQTWVASAPLLLVECAPGDRIMSCGHSARVMDGAIAMAYMTLEAVSLGLQFCWLGRFDSDKVRAVLNIPADHVVAAVAPVGYPEEPGAPRPKKSLAEAAVYNRMG